MKRAVLEIAIHSLRTKRKNRVSAVRLNGTSDIVWERRKFVLFPEVKAWLTRKFPIAEMEQNKINRIFPTVQFYDYTAIRGRDALENYHLTFSMKEDNLMEVLAEMKRGRYISVAFPVHEILRTQRGLPVISTPEPTYSPAT